MKTLKMLIFITALVISVIYFIGCSSHAESDLHEHEASEHASCDHDHSNDGHDEKEHGEEKHDEKKHDEEEHSDEIVLKPEIMTEVDFKIVPVGKRKFEQINTYPGKVTPRLGGEAHVGSLIGGRVVEIAVGLGDRVSKGISLCKIESPEIGLTQSAYIRAVVQNNLAQKDLIRHQKLTAENIGSEKTLLEKEAAAKSAQAELAASERALFSIGFSESEITALMTNHSTSGILTLKSPIAGTVTDLSIRLGQRVEPNRDLFHIVELARLWVQISLYEKDLAYIRNDQSVEIIPQSFPENTFQGKIVRIGREVKGETRTIDCFVEVANPKEILIPNLFVTCHVLVGTDTDDEVLSVPEDAIIMDQHGDRAVYIEHEPQCFVLKEVETGRSSNGWVEVIEGLKAGDRVVFKGAFFIKSEAAKGSFGHGHEH